MHLGTLSVARPIALIWTMLSLVDFVPYLRWTDAGCVDTQCPIRHVFYREDADKCNVSCENHHARMHATQNT